MAGYLTPQGFDPNAPGDFDYNAQQQRLNLQQALAKQLGQGLGDGKMVGGWYSAPGKGAYIANALQQALGGYMQVKNSEGQSALDKADRDAMIDSRKAYGAASDPSNYMDKAEAAYPTPQAGYLLKEGVLAGPPDPRTPAPPVEPAPVLDPNIPVQNVTVSGKRESPFNVMQPSAEEVAASRAGQIKYLKQAMGADREAALDRMSRTKSGGPLANAIMARDYSPAEWDMQKIKEGDNEVLVAVNKKDPTQMRKVFGGDALGLPSIAERRLQFDQSKDARDSAAAAKRDERDYGFKVDESKSKNSDKMTDNARNDDKLLLDINEKRATSRADLATTQSGIGTIEKGMALVGKWNARGGPLSQARLSAGLAVGENDAVEVDRTLKAIAALNMKSIFGAAPSDSERAAFEKVIGDAASGKTAALSGLDEYVHPT